MKHRFDDDTKIFSQIVSDRLKCSCGHTFTTTKEKHLCSWCGNYVYKDKKNEFTEKLMKEIKIKEDEEKKEQEKRYKFLVEREKILQTVEMYLVGRINKLKKLSSKEFEFAVIELEKLSKVLEEERNNMYSEVEDERENDERTYNEIERDSKRTRYITNRV